MAKLPKTATLLNKIIYIYLPKYFFQIHHSSLVFLMTMRSLQMLFPMEENLLTGP